MTLAEAVKQARREAELLRLETDRLRYETQKLTCKHIDRLEQHRQRVIGTREADLIRECASHA